MRIGLITVGFLLIVAALHDVFQTIFIPQAVAP
jgi:hypothetical protein